MHSGTSVSTGMYALTGRNVRISCKGSAGSEDVSAICYTLNELAQIQPSVADAHVTYVIGQDAVA